jgi:phosphoglycolate phosphatase
VVAPTLTAADLPRFSELYLRHYLGGDADIPLFDGVPEMLDELDHRGFLLGVATGKTRAGLARALARHGIAHRFVASRCADETFPKPHPAMLLSLIELVGAHPDETLMIGDTTHDLDLARNAGVSAVAVAMAPIRRTDSPPWRPRRLCIRSENCAHGWQGTPDLRDR